MAVSTPSKPAEPQPWGEWKAWIGKHRWLYSFARAEWASEWLYYRLRSLAVFDLLELAGKLTVLVAVIFWFLEVGAFQVRLPEDSAAQIRLAEVEVSSFILPAHRLVAASEDGEDGLNVRRRPDSDTRWFSRVLRLFGCAFAGRFARAAALQFDERIGEAWCGGQGACSRTNAVSVSMIGQYSRSLSRAIRSSV